MKKGFRVELRRYDELLVRTLRAAQVALSRGDDAKEIEASLKEEVDRQCSRTKYILATGLTKK
jgi:hypothetical protein